LDLPADDVRKALVEASEGTVGSAMDQILMYCFQYDPNSNSYVIHATNLMKLGGMLTLVVIGIGLFVFWRRETDGGSIGIPRPASG
jgi:protein SCO1/2